ncbi:MAG: hypothetical protein RL557_64 [archaeon]|jgi:chorismate mutase
MTEPYWQLEKARTILASTEDDILQALQDRSRYKINNGMYLPASPESVFERSIRTITLHPILKQKYLEMISGLCPTGEDKSSWESAAHTDLSALQHISKRIEMGTHVAQAKFSEDEDAYRKLIRKEDRQGIRKKLRDETVEKKSIGTDLAESKNTSPSPATNRRLLPRYHYSPHHRRRN